MVNRVLSRGHVVGGIGIIVDGDCPGLRTPAALDGPCDTVVRLRPQVSETPLRPQGEPAHEADSWVAFTDDSHFHLCIKWPDGEPMRVELPRDGLEGTLWFRRDVPPPLFGYPTDQLLLIHALGVADGFLAHAAAIADANGGYLCAGPSGAGKTTLSIAAHDVGARVLSDERTVVRRGRDGWLVGGTPWPGEGGYVENATVPLRGIMLLEQAATNELVPVSPARALAMLYRCHFPPLWDDVAATRTLSNIERLVREVPAFILKNRRGPEVARMLLARLASGA
jgi:hypothetical protein